MSDILSIKQRASSIKNIGKITKSLETVSAMQLKSTEKRLVGTKEYFKSLIYLSRKLSATAKNLNYESPFTNSPKQAKKTLFLLVTTDRGLVGAQNLQFFYNVNEFLKLNTIDDCDFMIFGARGSNFGKVTGHVIQEWKLTDRIATAHEATKEILEAFKTGLYSHVYLAYNEFITMQNIEVVVEQFLPLELPKITGFSSEIIEPNFDSVFTLAVDMYLSYVLRHSFLEAEASEHAARTLAMKSASDNAQELSRELTHLYNNARQEAVTEEILEGAFHHG